MHTVLVSELVMCVDIGSTYTKGVLVDVSQPDPWVSSCAVPTTNPLVGSGQDVLAGLDQVCELLVGDLSKQLGVPLDVTQVPVLGASSAGGGLRIAVIGYESEVTAEAGRRAALSAGGKITSVYGGVLDCDSVREVFEGDTDLILLVGGTNGGNASVLVQNAAILGRAMFQRDKPVPIVVAGNVLAQPAVAHALSVGQVDMSRVSRGARTRLRALSDHELDSPAPATICPEWVTLADNVLPAIGTFEPESARIAIRESFLKHVIRGKGLSASRRFPGLIRGATPDMVLRGVEVLSSTLARYPHAKGNSDSIARQSVASESVDFRPVDVLVVDVGGATTDVYSVVSPEGEDASLRKEVVAPAWKARTVEGDLGMRWSAAAVVVAAQHEALFDAAADVELKRAAAARSADPSGDFSSEVDAVQDVRIATLAVTCALRRHARPPSPTKSGKDLRRVGLVVGSGGVLRHHSADVAAQILAPAVNDFAGGWRVPESPDVVVDYGNRLLAAGLLLQDYPEVAVKVAASLGCV